MKSAILVVIGLIGTAAWGMHGDQRQKLGRQPVPDLIRSAKSGPWSVAVTWEGGKVPGAGAKVQVRAGHTVTYDLSSDQVIRSIHVAGTLTFARDRDTRLDVGLIKIQPGEDANEDGFDCDAHVKKPDLAQDRPALEVGTSNDPIRSGHTALIRLAAVLGLDKETCPAIVCCGGRMDLHGAPLSRTWVKLGATVNAGRMGKSLVLPPGDTEIRLAEPVTGWHVGDRILVTTTTSRERINRYSNVSSKRIGLRPGPGIPPAFTEERTIKAIDGDHITVDRPLDYFHEGKGDYRGEVANLSRNVIVESADPAQSRGHTMYHKHSAGAISYAEFRHLGKEGLLGKYPIHVHLAGDTMRGSYVMGASICDSGNRWVTVHGTSYFVVRDCVGYQSVGHGYFLEDGSEVFNVFDRNLAVQAFAGKPLPEQFLPFDHNDGAGFWWANSQNTFIRNVAVECDRYGFRFEATPTKGFDLRRPVLQPDGSTEPVDIRTLSFIHFEDNEAHDHLFGVNLGGLGGDFFAPGVGDVVPDQGSPFFLQKTRIWNTHWAFAPHTRYAVDRLDIADSTYGLFLPAYDAEVLPPRGKTRREENPDWGSITFRRTQVPVRLPDTKPGYFGKPFDLMAFEGDIQPPATVITHVTRDKSGGQLVRGTTAENETVAKVLVNGREAKATAANFAEWQITLDGFTEGDIKLSAHAIDDSGNVEPRPHNLLIRMRGGKLLTCPSVDSRASPASWRLAATTKISTNPREASEDRSDASALRGTWQVVSQQRTGRSTARPRSMLWIVEGETIWLVPSWLAERERQASPNGNKPAGPPRGLRMSFRLSRAKSPKHIDIEGLGKSASLGIYQLDGDKLTLCMGVTQASPVYDKRAKSDENTRPAAVSPEAGTVIVLKKIK
jgi:uncharacterized protein (TIGR03067 family)